VSSTPSPRILYIEDDPDQREAVADLLRSVGCEVQLAASGEEGLALIESADLEAVFCDLNMPGMGGLEVLDRSRAARPRLPFVVVTGHGSIALGVQATKRGAQNFITKPLTAEQLGLAVEQAVEHGRMQRRLRDSETILEMLLETVPDIIYSLDPEGRFLSVSPSGERALGYRIPDMLGRSVFELVHPDDRERVKAGMVRAIQDREDAIRNVEFRMLTAAGEVRDFEIRRRLIFDESGRVIRNDGIARDVTERKRVAAQMQAVLDSARNAIVVVDGDGRITAANRSVGEYFAVDGEPVGLPFAGLLEEIAGCFEEPARFRELADQLIEQPDDETHDQVDQHVLYGRALLVTRPVRRYMAVFSTPVRARAGQELGRVWIFADITQFKEADEQLHKIVEASPVPLIITRVEDGEILFANEHLAALVGVPLDELVGRRSPDFYAEPGARQVVVETLKRDGQIKDHEVLFRRPDGTRFWALLSLVLAEVGGERVIVGGVHDIDERKRIEDALRWERNFVSAVLDTAGALVVVLDREGRVVRFNTACQQTTGYTFDEVRGRPFWETLLLPEEAEDVKEVFRSLQAGNFPNTHANHWRTKDGDRRYINWSNTALTARGGKERSDAARRSEATNVTARGGKERSDAARRSEATNVTARDGEVEYIVATGIDITEKQLAEEKLRLYREIFMNTSDGITILSPEGEIVERNPAHERISGYSDEEIIGKPSTFLLREGAEAIGRELEERGSFRGEVRATTKRGERVDIDLSVFPILDAAGQPLCFAGMGREITQRKRAQEAIATRLRYEEALAACSRILLTAGQGEDPLDAVLQHLLAATRASRVMVFRNVETPDRGLCFMPTHEARAEGIESVLDRPELACLPYSEGLDRWVDDLSSGEPIHGHVSDLPSSERALLAPQGLGSVLALSIRVGECWYGFISFDDVGDETREWSEEDVRALRTAAEMISVHLQRQQAEEALRVSEERFRRLVENANDVIYSLSPDGSFSYISPRFTEQTGYSAADYLGRAADFIHPDDWGQEKAWLQEAAPRGIAQQGFEYRFRHRDGSWRWAVSNASVLRDPDGNLQEIVGVAHDITEMKQVLEDLERANQELKAKQAQLVQSEKMASLGMLVAGIAHEINTPIGAVASAHNTLVRSTGKLKAVLDKEAPGLLEENRRLKLVLKAVDESNQVIQSGTDRVTTIVRRLKSFARLDEAELKTVDIHEGLEDTLTIIHHELKHKVEVARDYGELPAIACFPSQLNQVFLNLFINANQAIEDRGTIRIKTRVRGDRAVVEVRDDGVGMPLDVQKRIFDPGFTTKGVGVGTGLGLSICYQIIQDHHGEIRVESEEGVGTAFTVVLPLNLQEILEVSL
jgi:PAS domain S-box-containing protein